jgi:hypothetical protein
MVGVLDGSYPIATRGKLVYRCSTRWHFPTLLPDMAITACLTGQAGRGVICPACGAIVFILSCWYSLCSPFQSWEVALSPARPRDPWIPGCRPPGGLVQRGLAARRFIYFIF